jgi:hypothetical protein
MKLLARLRDRPHPAVRLDHDAGIAQGGDDPLNGVRQPADRFLAALAAARSLPARRPLVTLMARF